MIMPKIRTDYEPIACIDLRTMCRENLPKKFPSCQIEKAKERLEKELAIIEAKEWCSYFCHVSAMIRAAAERNLAVTHRGTVYGSIVAYLSGITDINPLDHDLIYESFIGPDGENTPYFEINIADHVTIDEMVSGLSEIPAINRGNTYTVPVKDGRPGAIVIIPSKSVGKITPLAEQLLSTVIVDRTLRNEMPDFEKTIQDINPYVIRYTESAVAGTLQNLWHKTGVAPIRSLNDADIAFDDFLLRKGNHAEEQSLSIPLCFGSVALEKLIEKLNITSVKELTDAFSLNNSTYCLKNEMISFCCDKTFLNESDWKICDRENVFETLCKRGVDARKAFCFMSDLVLAGFDNEQIVQKWSDVFEKLHSSGTPDWYEKHLKSVRSLFSRAHSAECVMNSLSLLRYKMDYPEIFTEAWMEAHKDMLQVDERALTEKEHKIIFEEYVNYLNELEKTDDCFATK